MPSRLHISSFVALTLVAWLVALWMQGEAVISPRFLKPFGLVVTAIVSVTAFFNRSAWAWKVFRGWYVQRPDLRGTWRVSLVSDWKDPASQQPVPPIEGYLIIRQTLMSLSARLVTKESCSRSIANSLAKEEDDIFRLSVVYRNEPSIELQGKRSEIHHGAFWLEVLPDADGRFTQLKGHYWTDRKTRGSMLCVDRVMRYFTTFDEAQREHLARHSFEQMASSAS
jgi:hypothetical protein